jgi:type VI secretion system protein ImpC
MSERTRFGQIDVRVGTGSAAARPVSAATPFRILVLGDFSGNAHKASKPALRPVFVDRDNIDEVLAGFDVRLPSADGRQHEFKLASLDDFHPDSLHRNVVPRLGQPPQNQPPPATEPPPQQNPAYSVEGLFDQTLDETKRRADQPADSWDAIIRSVGEAHAAPKPTAAQREHAASKEKQAGQALRGLLHDPRFQQLEAAWRGLDFLTRRLDTDTSLKIYVADVSRSDLAADLTAGDDLAKTALYRLLVEETLNTPGGLSWAAIVGLYTFDATADDADLLGRIAKIAAAAGAPFIAAAHERLAGCPSLAESADPDDWRFVPDDPTRRAWDELKKLPQIASVGLALPQFLLRLPYGRRTNPIESLAFDEFPGPPKHDQLLWGSPAILAGLLLGQSFSADGWRMEPGDYLDVTDLPLLIYDDAGERRCYPCAEALLTDRAIDRIRAAGLMPLIWPRDSDRVRLGGFYSLAGINHPLAGR